MIRPAGADDLADILGIHTKAFGSDAEAKLVELMLRDPSASPYVSLVAEEAGRLVGHALFTPVKIEGAPEDMSAAILAPLAVHPDQQGSGAGSRLVHAGLESLAQRGTDIVFVYGDPNYYGRFGFRPAFPLGLVPQNDVPQGLETAWTVRGPDEHLTELSGTVRCCDVLGRPEYW